MNVADAMTPRSEVVTAEIPGTRDEALVHLQQGSFSSMPAVKRDDDGEDFRGIVSRNDLIERPNEDQLALLVREVPTISENASIEELTQLMIEENSRRIPVVDGQLEGIVTITDVIRAIADGDVDTDATADDIATRNVNTTYAGAPLAVAESGLQYANDPYAIILDDDGEMVGILTEVDVIEVANVVEGEDDTGDSIAGQDDEWMWEGIKAVGNRYLPTRNVEFPDGPASEFMTSDVVTVSAHNSVRDVAQSMITNDIEQVPLFEGGELVRIVRDVDILSAVGR
ncbi:MAG: CBS domain-containing protein [Halobacteriales archaeon]